MLGGGGKDYMSKFVKISAAVLVADEKFAEYLRRANIVAAKKGGAFVGNYEVASDEFRKYGIVLPKGGMIIPDAEPDKLKEIVSAPERRREAEDIKSRRSAEESYLNQVKEMLAKSGVSDIQVVVKDGREHHNIGSSLWHKSFLARDEETIFSLHSEEEPYRGLGDDKSYKPWRTSFTPLEKVELFLKEEAGLAEPRRLLADRINQLVEMSHAVGQQTLGEDGWDRPRVELFLYDDYSQTSDWGFFGHRCKSVFSAHRIMYRKKLYKLTEEDITRLEGEVVERAEQATARQEMLKKLFFERLGVFSYQTRRYESSEVRHSFVDGKVIDDSWTERHYFLGKEEATREEYEWLNTFLGEIAVSKGYIRIPNDTNDLLRVPAVPGRSDVLVVEGKTGSRRGVWSYGEWFRGHPSECAISFWHKGTARKIKSVTLNGQIQESNSVNLALWTDPQELAKRALHEAGMANPAREYIEALAEVYRRQLEENPSAGKRAISVSSSEAAVAPRCPDVQQPTPAPEPSNRQESGNGFGLGMSAWGALNGLKL